VALLCGLLTAPSAHGFVVAGKRWPGPTITIWNATGYKVPVRDAERAWNGAGADIRFVPAGSVASADVVVRYGVLLEQGRASLGYGPGGSDVRLSRGLRRMVATTVAAHELGHVLGLGHESRGCTLMAPVVIAGSASSCGIAACRVIWRCLVQRDDAGGAMALYGGRPPV
jgi:hypothetical protein